MNLAATVTRLLSERLGLSADLLGLVVVERALDVVLGKAESEDRVERAAHLLRGQGEEWEMLVDEVTVPETWFFRDKEPFQLLASYVREKWRPANPYGTLPGALYSLRFRRGTVFCGNDASRRRTGSRSDPDRRGRRQRTGSGPSKTGGLPEEFVPRKLRPFGGAILPAPPGEGSEFARKSQAWYALKKPTSLTSPCTVNARRTMLCSVGTAWSTSRSEPEARSS